MKKDLVKSTYQKLLTNIACEYQKARAASIQSYWKIGRYIVQEEQKSEMRAQYGTDLIKNVSHDLKKKYQIGCFPSNLRNMRCVFINNQIYQPAGKLMWSAPFVKII